MSGYSQLQQSDRRLVILQALKGEPDYSINEYVIHDILGYMGHGHGVSAEVVREELGWLENERLITVEDANDIKVARITDRGVDVANSLVTVEGVKRPRPGA